MYAPHALKGQKLLAQGIALGFKDTSLSPCKGKSFKAPGNLQSFCPYRALCSNYYYTQGDAQGGH